eukprot:4821816-Amphidinium_carterae.1
MNCESRKSIRERVLSKCKQRSNSERLTVGWKGPWRKRQSSLSALLVVCTRDVSLLASAAVIADA